MLTDAIVELLAAKNYGKRIMAIMKQQAIEEKDYNQVLNLSYFMGNSPWPEAESLFLELDNKEPACQYAYHRHKRWPELEQALLANPSAKASRQLGYYAINCLQAPWPEAEDRILKDGPAMMYAEVIKGRWPELEAKGREVWDFSTARFYAQKVLLLGDSKAIDWADKFVKETRPK